MKSSGDLSVTSSLCNYQLLLLFLCHAIVVVGALQTTSSSATLKLEDTICRLQLSIGRVEGTVMPADWAASGVRLTLPNLELQFRATESDDKEKLLGPLSSQRELVPLTEPTLVDLNGQQRVRVEKGAYCLYRHEGPKMNFRFFLDFPEGAERNDVKLPAERVFFTSICWLDGDELANEVALQQKTRVELRQLEVLYDKLDDDRGVLQQTLRLRSKILLKDRISLLRARLDEQDEILPDVHESPVIQGPGVIFSKEGCMTVKRYGGILGMREEYHIVGTFKITEFVTSV
jgi:hypothetical protein